MSERKSFMLYLDAIEQWDMLTDEQAGVLIKALLRYSKTGERLETSDGMLKMAFSFITAQIDRDGEKWEKTCEKRRDAAYKKWNNAKDANAYNSMQNMQMHTNAYNSMQKIQMNTNDTDTVTDTETVTDIIKENNIKEKSKRFVKPTLEQVQAYCRERNNNINAQTFIDFYEANGWVQGRAGKPLKDWKAAVRTWEKNNYNNISKDDNSEYDKYNAVVNKFLY